MTKVFSCIPTIQSQQLCRIPMHFFNLFYRFCTSTDLCCTDGVQQYSMLNRLTQNSLNKFTLSEVFTLFKPQGAIPGFKELKEILGFHLFIHFLLGREGRKFQQLIVWMLFCFSRQKNELQPYLVFLCCCIPCNRIINFINKMATTEACKEKNTHAKKTQTQHVSALFSSRIT